MFVVDNRLTVLKNCFFGSFVMQDIEAMNLLVYWTKLAIYRFNNWQGMEKV
jgi:hypothetical protein